MNIAEEQLRFLFEQASDGIFISDAEGHYLDVNPSGCRMLGYTREEIIAMSIADLVTPDEVQRIDPELEVGRRDGRIKNHWIFRRKDQSTFIGEVSAVKLSDGRLQATIRNMSEQMQMMEVIRKGEERSRLTLDHMLEGCQILGHDFRYLYLNRTAEIHNRRPNEELLGKLYMDMWPGIEQTEVFRIIKNVLEKRVSYHLENYFIYPDGRDGWFDLSIQPVPDGVFILSIDITERKKAEYALRDSEEKYRTVSENTDDWIYWVSPEAKFKYISPACESMTGYTPQEFTGQPSLYMDIVVPEDKEKVHNHHIESMRGDMPPHSLKYRIITKKGQLCWIDHNCTPLFTNGKYEGLIGTNRDITELKLTEERLYESELKFRKIFEDGPYAMALVNSEFKFLMVNAQLCNMIGYSESELLNHTFRDVTSSKDVRHDILQIKKLINREINVYKTEKRYLRKDGQEIWGSLTVTPNFSDDGQFLYNVAIIEDITRRKQAEEELQKVTERLQLATNVANVGIWDWDIQHNELIWDEKMYELNGVSPKEFSVSYEGWKSILHPDDMDYCNEAVQKAIQGEADYNIEYRVIWADHSVHWLSAEGKVIRDEKHRPVRMIGVNYDVTESKLAAEELLASKNKLETAIESMTDAVFITDITGTFTQFNEAFAHFHKFNSKQECSRILADYATLFEGYSINGDPILADQWPISRSLRGETAKDEQLIVHRTDTRDTWFASYSYAPLRDSNGQVTGSVVVARDITESKKAEEALRISEERYRNIFESAVIGIYRTTPDGRIIMANPTLVKILGYDSLEELMKRNLEEEGFEDSNKRHEFREKIEQEGQVTSLESSWKTKGGRMVTVSENAKAFRDIMGNILYYEGTIEDITERKQMERNLRESEEKFRMAFSINPDAIAINSFGTGQYVLINSGLTRMLEFTEEEAIGKTAMDLNIWINPGERKRFYTILTEKGYIENFESTLRAKSGRLVHVLVSSSIIEMDGIKHILTSTRDITELKQAQEEVRKNEALLNEMGRMAQIGGWEYYPQSGKVIWTEEVSRIHDLDPVPMVSVDTGISYYYGKSEEIIKEAVKEAIEKVRPYDLELQIKSAKGVIKWVRSIGNPVVEGGKVIRITGSFQDITTRKKTEEALRRSEENMRLMMESISLPVAYIDNQGNILFRNTKFIQVFGYSEEEIPTLKEWWQYAFPDPDYRKYVLEEWDQFVKKAQETGKDTVSDEFSITCKDGSVRVIITSGVILDSNMLITLIDITERKQAEEQIKKLNETLEKRVEERTYQLMEANKELEAFSYSVSHDLRAPLRHINGFVDLLKQKYNDQLPEKGQHYLHTIVESANHMGTLIDDLLQFSRTGRQEMQKAQLNMNSVVMEVMRLLAPDINNRNIKWEIAHLPDVLGDHALLRMVWFNLLSNAVKFTKNKPLAVIQIGYLENDKEYSFFVRDNGAGFDMKYVHKLFGVFQRLHSRQEFEGTGIGLANVRRIVQKHGGRTWAESQQEEGSVFYFSLPKRKEQHHA